MDCASLYDDGVLCFLISRLALLELMDLVVALGKRLFVHIITRIINELEDLRSLKMCYGHIFRTLTLSIQTVYKLVSQFAQSLSLIRPHVFFG